MTEHQGSDKYIKCSMCKCKYINTDDNIKKDFGYNRLNEKFKTCVKCRAKRTCDKCGLEVSKNVFARHQKSMSCKQWELLQSRVDISDPDIVRFDNNLNGDPIPVYNNYEKAIEYKDKYLGYDRNKKEMSVEEQIKLLDI